MRKQIAIFIACLILPLSAVRADSDSVCKVWDAEIADKQLCTETGGCQFLDGRCEKCEDGTYGEYGVCLPCDKAWAHSHLLDDYGHIYLGDSAPTGATKPEHCYQECKEDGVRISGTKNAFKVKTSDTAYYPNTCVYTLGCDVGTTTNANGKKVTNVCNSYFAYPNTDIDSGSCQPQWWHPTTGNSTKPPYVGATIECNDNEHTKDKYYIYISDEKNSNHGKFKCYANTCVDGYVVVPDKNIVCDINNTFLTLGQCEPRVKGCKSDANLVNECTNLLGGNAAVAGLIEWDDTAEKYNYDKCTCTIMQDINDSNKKVGERSFQCKTASGGNEASWDEKTCKPLQIEKCYAGYYESKDPSGNTVNDTCKQTEPGYYSPAPGVVEGDLDGKTRYPCPAGRSSTAGAGSESDCGIKRGTDGTKFCDSVGCFTLPGSGEIIKFVGDKTN